jgi:hypothetical protein
VRSTRGDGSTPTGAAAHAPLLLLPRTRRALPAQLALGTLHARRRRRKRGAALRRKRLACALVMS